MTALRILTFNWHEAYICLLARTGHCFTVVDKEKGGFRGWLHGTRPVPSNVALLPVDSEPAALRRAAAGEFELAICHNLKDLADTRGLRIPRVVVFHNRISTEIALFLAAGRPSPGKPQYIDQFLSLFDSRTTAVFISESKRVDAERIPGRVILPGIDLDDYGGYRGDQPRILRIGNFFTGRDLMLGQTTALAASRELPVTVLGINPEIPGARLSSSWDELREHYRSHRAYLNTTVEGAEDGYNLSMLEAMATGMPVVAAANATSPVRDGENGFISGDCRVLHAHLETLLRDRGLARRLGAAARDTVAESFPMGHFVESWNELFESAIRPAVGKRRPAPAWPAEIHRPIAAGLWSEARAALEAVVEREPPGAEGWKELGLVYRRMGREPEAIRAFWAASRLDPGDEEVRRLHVMSLLEIAPGNRPQDNPEAAAVACICRGKGIDVGCGPNKSHPEAIGIDLTPGGEAGTAGGVKGQKSAADVCASGDNLHMFADGSLDYVVARHNLEHYRDPLKALEEWKRVLKPGGLLGLVLPDDREIDTIRLDETHKHVFTPDSFQRLAGYLGGFGMIHLDTCLHQWSFCAILQKCGGTGAVYDYQGAVRRSSAERCRTRAIRYEQDGEPLAALECWREAQALDAADAESVRGQVRVLRRLGRLAESAAVLAAMKPAAFGSGTACPVRRPAPRRAARGSPIVDLAPPRERKRILLSYCANPMTTASYFERALRRRHDVRTWGPPVDDRILRAWDMMALSGKVRPTDLGYDTPNVFQALKKAPGWQPDLFLWIESGVQFPIEGLQDLSCPKACYLIDTHIDEPGDRRVDAHLLWAARFDSVFLAQRAYVERFRAAGVDAHWLPLACDPEIHRDAGLQRTAPVAFVGSLNQARRRELLERLAARLPVKLERCFLEDMARVFSGARIVFNNAVNDDLNMRVFEAMACGAMLVTDAAPGSGLEDLFEDGKHLAIFRKDPDLPAIVEHWLSDHSRLNAVAAAGRQEVLSHHTYEHRAVLMESILFKDGAETAATGAAAVPQEITALARSLLVPRQTSGAASGDEPRLGRCRILLASGRREEARRFAEEWLGREPLNGNAIAALGCVALAQGDYEGALRRFRQALERDAEDARALTGAGLALYCDGREMEATDALASSLELQPTQNGVLEIMIRAAGAVGRFREARDAVRRLRTRVPRNTGLLFSDAVLSARCGQREEALRCLDVLEDLDPRYPNLGHWRGLWSRVDVTN